MKLHVLSDVHFEHMRNDGVSRFFEALEEVKKRSPADTAVLAGDICSIYHANRWKDTFARLCSMYRHLLYVPGNHEYYGSSFRMASAFLSETEKAPDFHNLVNLDRLDGAFEIDGQRFLGGTMWFADKGYGTYQKRCMNDFFAINFFEPEVYNLNSQFVNKFVAHVRPNDIVVTHHTPLPASIHPQYADSDINDFFMSDRTYDLYEGRLPKIWIHGHTHNAFDYIHQVGTEKMRVYCNPHGYPSENSNRNFWSRVSVEVL